ncbi:methyltransferase domain-containing protein [Arachidicoccus terrestris]|uniref:class I SAM-dependent methyltransferase n=1 Tax=Arachidicoccus terrestris TaxID=2875539 RepID=UPI001CC673BE|nr:class I SAM-dependent methyltransferase [Arachidicoccus terrestris]UAY53973.1 class I SAM-dependent methyltransferase [Arachidicoccus terrestris]
MIIRILAENDYLADILHKNPNTDEGLYAKPLRDGIVIGNTVSRQRYDVLFWDKKKSYASDRSNQLDYQSLCNPLTVLNICTELFTHLLRSKEDYIVQELPWLDRTRGELDTVPCTVEVPVFYINSNWYRNGCFLLERYFEGVQLVHESGCNFRLSVTGENVFEALNLLNLVAIFTHLTNVDGLDTFIDNSLIDKYVRVLTNIEKVPYFVFYLFIKRAVKNQGQFLIAKPVFESYLAKYGLAVNFMREDTQQSRIRFVTEAIGIALPVLDIGCGEFSYYKRLMNMGLTANYYAIDRDERLERLARSITYRIESSNLLFRTDFNEVPKEVRLNVIISEVIEHNSVQDAVELIKVVLQFNFNKVVISTPNADFNQFYFEQGFRHTDHQFEFSIAEFKQFIETATIGLDNINVSYAQVGDQINGLRPTQLCILEKI